MAKMLLIGSTKRYCQYEPNRKLKNFRNIFGKLWGQQYFGVYGLEIC